MEAEMEKCRVLVVLGSYGVLPFNQLTEEALRRLERALQLWMSGEYSYLLLSGGIVADWSEQTKSEAELMQEWLQNRLVADGRMIIESCGTNEIKSVIHAVRLLWKRVITDAEITIIGELPGAVMCKDTFIANGFGPVRCEFVAADEDIAACA